MQQSCSDTAIGKKLSFSMTACCSLACRLQQPASLMEKCWLTLSFYHSACCHAPCRMAACSKPAPFMMLDVRHKTVGSQQHDGCYCVYQPEGRGREVHVCPRARARGRVQQSERQDCRPRYRAGDLHRLAQSSHAERYRTACVRGAVP